MDNLKNVLQSARSLRDSTISDAIEEFGARRPDLIDLGLADYTARRWLHTVSPRVLLPTEAVQVPPVGLNDVVALVPVSEIARRYLGFDVYLRDEELRVPVRLCATHLGWSDGGTIRMVRPITQRWRMGSAAAIAATNVAKLSAIRSQHDWQDNWPRPAMMVELGAPIKVGLPLGFAANPTGGAPAIPGVRHFFLAALLAGARSGLTLVDLRPI